MSAAQSVQLYQILQEHFGQSENAAKAVSAIEAIIDEKVDTGNKRYEELLHKDIEILRSDLTAKIAASEGALRTEMREQKVDMVKWFVGLFVALALMIIGLYVKR